MESFARHFSLSSGADPNGTAKFKSLKGATMEQLTETKARETIIIVDDNLTNLKMGKNALSDNYDVLTAPSAEKLFDLLAHYPPDMILLDIDMPVTDGFETIKILKGNPKTRDIPVIFLTGANNVDTEIQCLKLGAADFISKPFAPELLNMRVALHLEMERRQRLLITQDEKLRELNKNLEALVDKKTRKVLNLQISMLQTVAELVERRDSDTGGHIARTQSYLKLLLNELIDLGLYHDQIDDNWDLDLVVMSSQLHDVGKIGIADNILMKPGKLTAEEFNEIKRHTVYGAEIIEKMMEFSEDKEFLQHAKVFAETHQEKWDGSGYPHGLAGEEIPLLGRLMAIADVYDALVSVRPYKKPLSHDEALKIIRESKGKHFDPVLVEIFEHISDKFVEVFEASMQKRP
jgi:putative two-component system response regulator